ncbi:A-kinase-interacting protein 1 [Arapaima gigas]
MEQSKVPLSPMATPAWIESSLRCSSRLGLEVLERARARRVHWPRVTGASSEDGRGSSAHLRASRSEQTEERCMRSSASDAFDTVMELMAHTTDQCKVGCEFFSPPDTQMRMTLHGALGQQNLYTSVPVYEHSEQEAKHICRYHTQASRRTGHVKHVERPRTPEDFLIEVPPGTYTVTAGAEDASQQSQLVHVSAGDSVKLTFHL